jgi:hypothetical protein
MTPEEYVRVLEKQYEIIGTARDTIYLTSEFAHDNFVWPEDVRPAASDDIVVGQIVYHIDGDDGPFWNIVEEVLRPNDSFKAYCADDGCRYGLDGAWVKI